MYKEWGIKKWEKEHQARERKIKQHLIKLVDDVESIPIIVEKGFVPIVDLVEVRNYESLVGEIDIDPLMETKVSIDN